MPMDYDDNDTTRHNIQLAGEGRSRSSSALRPYDFPKFDFDDTLQGHLRFDSLVETEVFLGIQSQEDNQWIEDFSRVSNGMEFNSTPADSCSISRRNNVWSEATSSESVEMLLKSVGQEEMMPGDSIITESNATHDQGIPNKNVESSIKLIERTDAYVVNSDAALPPDELLEDCPASGRHIEKQLEDPSAFHAKVESASGISSNVNQNALCGNGGTLTYESNHSDHEERSGEKLEESQTSVGQTVNFGSGVDSLGFSSTTDNVTSNIGTLSTSKTSQQVMFNAFHESCSNDIPKSQVSIIAELDDTTILEGKANASSINIFTGSSSHGFVPESGRDCQEASLDFVQESTNILVKGESELKSSEGVDKNTSLITSIQTSRHEKVETALDDTAILEGKACVSSINIITGSSSRGSVPESGRDGREAILDFVRESANVLVKGESELKSSEGVDKNTSFTTSIQTSKHEKVVGMSNEVIEPFDDCPGRPSVDFASTEQDMDLTMQLPHKQDIEVNDNMEDVSAIRLNHESMSEMPSLSIEDNGVPRGSADCIRDTEVGNSSNISVQLSASDHQHNREVEGYHNECIVVGEEPGVAPDKDVPIQVIQENLVHAQADFSEIDICKPKEVDSEVSTDLGNIDSENVRTLKNDQRTQSAEVSEGDQGNNLIHKLQPQTSGEPESAINVSPFATTNASAALDDCPVIGQREPAAVGLFHSHNDDEEAGRKTSNDTNLGAEVDGASKVEDSVADDIVGIPVSEMAAKSEQPVDKIDDICSIGPSSVQAMNSLYSDHPQAHSDGNKKPSLKESADADLINVENHEKAMNKDEEKESAQIAEIDKTSCGSPTIISSSEPSQSEKDNQEEDRGYITNEVVKDIQSTSEDSKRKDLLGDDSSFTFKVNALPDTTEREPAKNWSPFPDVEKCKVVVETTPSGKGKTGRTPLKKTPRQNTQVSEGETGPGSSKGTSERKGRRKGTAKENAKNGNQSKGPTQENASMIMDKVSNMLSTPISNPIVQYGQMQAYGHTEANNKKPSGAVAVPTPSLPDLNASALNNSTPSSTSYRQPFTDLQQVQLRAQIFVYGSLIQGTAPDEACMVSAFGPSDGGRSTWEPIWRVAVERVRNQKSSPSAAETPSRSQSGARASDVGKQGSQSSKVPATPVSKASSKDTPAAVLSPMIPLSSPLWNISTPTRDNLLSNAMHKGPVTDFPQAVTPVLSYQTPPMRNYVGHTSWPSQSCFPAPWLVSPQTAAFSSTVRFQPVTMTETVKLTPAKDTSVVSTSSVKHTTSSPAVHNMSPRPVLGASPLHDPNKLGSAEQHSVDLKPRKRKKVPASDPSQVFTVSEAQTEALVISDVAAVPSSPLGDSGPACRASDAYLSTSALDTSRTYSINQRKKVDEDTGKAVACSEETLSKVAEAKSEAEDAANLASAAVSLCEDLWSQLPKKKDSGLTSEAEAKLASAAVAIAAAASVAKAAAAAAKIACNAALQAKLMANEVFLSNKNYGMDPSREKSSSDVQEIGNATPASLLKSNNVSSPSSSILLAAKEAAKRRVEAASAASRQAENLDAIVKAAELAAAAVTQAGKIVAMGEPLPLNELIEAGPEGYWKSCQPSTMLAEKGRDGALSLENGTEMSTSILAEASVGMGRSKIVGVDDVHSTEGPNGSLYVGVMESEHMDEKDFKARIDHNISDTLKSCKVASEPDAPQSTTNVKNERNKLGTHAEEGFKEGSSVEVFKPGNGLKSAWYSANILSVEDGKAYVCYNELLSEEGSGNLQEWVPFEGKGDKAPIIRAAQPSTALQQQQTRKRRRAAIGDYAWCVGDRVDVWIDDCWWEGVVTDKNEKDETTLKVHIPAQGETPTVRAWNLRASLSWIDGKWVEWSSSRGQNASEQGDVPQEKRQKLEVPQIATNANDKESSNVVSALGKHEPSKCFTLSTSERTFDIGKTTNDVNKRDVRRPLRTNQQKEGSRVIFGVPKPTGKKRKFMEVSKHFPANKSNKSGEVNESVKFTKYLMPQGAASRGWKVPSRNDTKEKRTVESMPRVVNTRKAHSTLPQRGNFRSTLTRDVKNSTGKGIDTEDSNGHDDTSEKSTDHGSDTCEDATEAPLSSLLSHSLSSASKKISSSNTKSDRLNRGKLVPSVGKLRKIEEDKAYLANTDKSTLDASEPRRSNRRIQPSHRLLEGFQSSMVIPKIASVSHEKNKKNLPTRGK
ncbi:hypothetical protein SOVF_049010 isoform B [Spinacia oleracea]|uniref:Uncharacterized protein isoform X2 n=1 Tax=Spinacia oleracea TaxID=3562 RepID=A0A9R0IW41_SPIOL|nr:uncharacterized protein LOC110795870 isoform X2 [Spinacia oleracea]KNA20811.1 hypothetical protein SOVF_049010 isoform B [Spinacia oleracea]